MSGQTSRRTRDDLRPYQNNPRLHPKALIDKLARAISDFGFLIPILIDDQNTVLAGHARIEAAKILALRKLPCIRASHLTEAQKRIFTILDNRLTEDTAWNFQLLAKEIEFLQNEGIDLTTTGFGDCVVGTQFESSQAHHAVPYKQRFPDAVRIAPNWKNIYAFQMSVSLTSKFTAKSAGSMCDTPQLRHSNV